MFDMIIEGGTVIDGTGGAPRTADIGIAHGKITEIGRLSGLARRKINADGLLVTPGFIDIHTHYDGQATWDDALYPSFDNGVTTAIVGNCGVGFAPAHPEQRETLVDLMDGVEEIPGSALAVGLKWDWETFPDYLEALERSPHSFNIGALATHGPLRVYTMGNKVIDRTPATSDEIARMCDLLDQALRAGACHAATLSSLAMAGLVSPKSLLSLISCLEIATLRSWMASWRWRLATTANTEASRTSTVSVAITARTIRRVRRCCRTSSPSISSLGSSRMPAASVAIWSRNLALCSVRPGSRRAQVISRYLGSVAKTRRSAGLQAVEDGLRSPLSSSQIPAAVSDDDQQMIGALAGDPVGDLFANPP